METLTLKDGTVVNGHILDSADGLKIYVYLDNMPLVDGVILFSDSAKTEKIIAMNHGTEKEYRRYTEICSASNEFGNCNLVMKRT